MRFRRDPPDDPGRPSSNPYGRPSELIGTETQARRRIAALRATDGGVGPLSDQEREEVTSTLHRWYVSYRASGFDHDAAVELCKAMLIDAGAL